MEMMLSLVLSRNQVSKRPIHSATNSFSEQNFAGVFLSLMYLRIIAVLAGNLFMIDQRQNWDVCALRSTRLELQY